MFLQLPPFWAKTETNTFSWIVLKISHSWRGGQPCSHVTTLLECSETNFDQRKRKKQTIQISLFLFFGVQSFQNGHLYTVGQKKVKKVKSLHRFYTRLTVFVATSWLPWRCVWHKCPAGRSIHNSSFLHTDQSSCSLSRKAALYHDVSTTVLHSECSWDAVQRSFSSKHGEFKPFKPNRPVLVSSDQVTISWSSSWSLENFRRFWTCAGLSRRTCEGFQSMLTLRVAIVTFITLQLCYVLLLPDPFFPPGLQLTWQVGPLMATWCLLKAEEARQEQSSRLGFSWCGAGFVKVLFYPFCPQ